MSHNQLQLHANINVQTKINDKVTVHIHTRDHAAIRTLSRSMSLLHSGQVVCFISHLLIHGLWYSCLQQISSQYTLTHTDTQL